jgi:predicted nucleotidyltransferase
VQRELAALAGAGILTRTDRANLTIYQANPASPVFAELKSLAVKTMGVGEVLRAALAPLAPRIRLAFVFGSFARGEQRQTSDVDVLVVSDDVTFGELVMATKSVEDRLSREVNPTLYGTGEFAEKLATEHPFLTRVVRGATILLFGRGDELERLVSAPSTPPLDEMGASCQGETGASVRLADLRSSR